MIVIVGLGNPGKKYVNNRHNVGFLMIDYIINQIQNSKFRIQNKNIVKKTDRYSSSKLSIIDSKFILAKPLTFMNLSGLAVKKLITHYALQTTSLIIIHDDLDIPLGKFHIQFATGPQLHNGLESIEQQLKTKDFWRVRIGVDNRQPKNNYLPHDRSIDNKQKWIDGETYTLQDFFPEENKLLKTEIFPKILSQLKLNFIPLL